MAGFYAYLLARGDTSVSRNPVPRGLVTRREREGRRQGAPLVRTTKTLPRVLAPAEVDALFGALRTDRDRAMVEAMMLGGLRRCEVLGLELADVRVGERRVFVSDGKGGRQRLIPMSGRFFATLGRYLDGERPKGISTERGLLLGGRQGADTGDERRCDVVQIEGHGQDRVRPGPSSKELQVLVDKRVAHCHVPFAIGPLRPDDTRLPAHEGLLVRARLRPSESTQDHPHIMRSRAVRAPHNVQAVDPSRADPVPATS